MRTFTSQITPVPGRTHSRENLNPVDGFLPPTFADTHLHGQAQDEIFGNPEYTWDDYNYPEGHTQS